MPKIVRKAEPEELELLTSAVRQWHPELEEAEVRIGLVLIEDTDGGTALTFAGAKALAKVRRLNPRDRLLTGLHVTLEVDADAWDEMIAEQRLALLDHELTHLVLSRDRHRHPKLNADGSPNLKLQPDDWVLNGFVDVVARHGSNAAETAAIAQLLNGHQGVFPFMLTAPPRPRLVTNASGRRERRAQQT